MRILVEDKWVKFLCPNGAWNGKLFEELIGALLIQLTGRKWAQTQKSWDGSRDFTVRFLGADAWAECKMYSRNIAHKELFPTLVMASNADIRTVWFFSYSDVTRGALIACAQFANSNGIHLKFFHDENLEDIILKQKEICREYFGLTLSEIGLKRPPAVLYARTWQSIEDGIASYNDMGRATGPEQIYLTSGGLFRVDVAAHNRTATSSLQARLKLGGNSRSYRLVAVQKGREFVESLDGTLDITMKPGQALWFRYFFQNVKNRQRFKGPKFEIVLSDPAIGSVENQSAEAFLVQSLGLRVQLVGNSVNSFIRKIKEQGSGRDRPMFIAVHGVSGAGKSRLLEELRFPMLENRYRIVSIEGRIIGHKHYGDVESRQSPYISFFSKLLALLTGLPTTITRLTPDFLRETGRDRGRFVPLDEIASLIQASEDNQAYRLRVESAIISLLESQARGTAIFIDNVQDCDTSVAESLLNIVKTNYGADVRFCLILAFNTQTWIRGAATENLLETLKGLSLQSGGSAHVIELADFDRKTFDAFITATVSEDKIFAQTHSHLLDMWWMAIEPRPLHITQALLLACDKHLLQLDSTRGILSIVNPEVFQANAANAFVSRQLADTMRERWTIIRNRAWKNVARRERAFRLFTFCGSLYTDVAAQLGICGKDMDDFVLRGLAEYNGSELTPFHRQTQRIFLAEILHLMDFYSKNNQKLFQYFLDAAKNVDLSQLLHQRFVAKYALGRLNAENLDEARHLLRHSPVEPHEEMFFEAVWQAASRGNAPFRSVSEQIATLEHVCEGWRHRQPWQVGHDRFVKADGIIEQLVKKHGYDVSVCAFKIAFANQMLVAHKDREILDTLVQAEHAAAQLPQGSLPLEFRGHLANRLCVAYKSIGQYSQALESGRRALHFAKTMEGEGRILRIRSLIDIGNIFQNGCHLNHPDDILHHGPSRVGVARYYWGKATRTFDELPAFAPLEADFEPMVNLYRAQIALLDGDIDACRRITERSIRICNERHSAFFGVKHMIIRALSFLIEDRAKNIDRAKSLTSEVVHWAESAQVYRYLWTTFWLEAKVATYMKRPDLAEQAYQKAAAKLDEAAGEEVKTYHYHFYDDLVLVGRESGWFNAESIQTYGIPRSLNVRYDRILALPHSDWMELCTAYRPTARYTVGQRNLPSP